MNYGQYTTKTEMKTSRDLGKNLNFQTYCKILVPGRGTVNATWSEAELCEPLLEPITTAGAN